MVEKIRKRDDAADLDRLWQPDEAYATVLAHARPLAVERVPFDQAIGRALAENIVATEDQPPFAAATMDGFAVVASDESPWREVIGDQTAGFVLDVEVTPGTAVRITTGAPVPPGATAVIPVERTEPADDHVVIEDVAIAANANIRPIGADLRDGERVLTAGTTICPAEIGLMAGLGVTEIPVRRRPRVSVLSTGNELVDPGERVVPGQIRDSNRFSLAAAVSSWGADLVWAGKAPDEERALRALIEQRIGESDVVITSGGVSMGHLDLVKVLLDELATVHFRRVLMKPGKPLNFATVGETLIFGLPGNPVSALVAFYLFIRPALAVMAGSAAVDLPRVPVRLQQEASAGDRTEFQRATVRMGEDGVPWATVIGPQASSRLASFVGANALLVLPPRASAYQPGEQVAAFLLGPPLGPDRPTSDAPLLG